MWTRIWTIFAPALSVIAHALTEISIKDGPVKTTENPNAWWIAEFNLNTLRVDATFLNLYRKVCGLKNISMR